MAEINKKIKEKLALLPDKPGVYLMKNVNDKIIYIGKSKSLKNRVRSYFSGTPVDNKTAELVKRIKSFDYIITSSEEQALQLEADLINKHKPRYNVLLKDDKHYPFIKITIKDDFPRILITREILKDGSKYFGPYTDARAVRKTLRMMEWIFPLKTCSRVIMEKGSLYKTACMNYQMGKCFAPCIGKISKSEYRKTVMNAIRFLNGKNQEVINELKVEMLAYSEEMKFEEAALVRDKILNIQKINNSKTLFYTDEKNRDVIAVYKENNLAAVTVMKILSGKLLNKEVYALDNVGDSDKAALLNAFLTQYYHTKLENLPHHILLQQECDDYETLNRWLKNKLHVPHRGENRILMKIAIENAFNFVEEQKLKHLRKSNRTVFPVTELKEKLNLKKLPRKMICIDISTIQGADTVSSLVYFENGKPKKKNYRLFKMKTVIGQDDFASMAETMRRYFSKITLEEKPDLIVIDGGKGQLSSAYPILKETGFEDIEMISLAKRIEEVFVPEKSDSILLPRNSAALRLLIQIRDEAHRTAVGFHRKTRSKRTLSSELDEIGGIGQNLKFMLLKEFGSVENIRNASITDLTRVKGVGFKIAKSIIDSLNKIES
ncbi:MAG: excinuclease ABC subunit UvrC [Candidatus Cloacimonetes bacterium]|nr:excinuclease ABC subunit UvrC [Candidatus Cloacimonadota bacterium]